LERDATLLAPIGPGSTVAFPGRPLVAVDLYASIRHGTLPNSSFAGYDTNVIRYVDDRNPMPGLRGRWLGDPRLRRFDYVLLRDAHERLPGLELVSRDGEWELYAVCGSRKRPRC
jgi:hypothetical protein